MSNATLLKELYQEELYVLPSPVLFILSHPWDTVSENDKTILTKMIGALKLSMASVRIITLANFATADLAAYAPSKVIALGATLAESSQQYQVLEIGGMSLVLAEPLHQLDDAKKKTLWLALRQMFGI